MKRYIQLIALSLLISFSANANNPVIQISPDPVTYLSYEWTDSTKISITDNDSAFYEISLADSTVYANRLSQESNFLSGRSVPVIEIVTDEPLDEIPDKINYRTATFTYNAFDGTGRHTTEVSIRGRGNSSWKMPKKPYRLKFNKKQQLFGLSKAKSFVLLANYTDVTMLENAIAHKIGNMLGLPYCLEWQPVEVILNGRYRGMYMMSNKPGINSGSVDIDEENSVMFEFDISYDEDLKFKSPVYNLPVQVKDPDLTPEQFDEWKADFIESEKAVATGNATDWYDFDDMVRYMLVNQIMGNNELTWPKSVKIYKTKGGLYHFGPLWDFDWIMGYRYDGDLLTGTHHPFDFSYATKPALLHKFLNELYNSPTGLDLQRKYWSEFKDVINELWDFIDSFPADMYNGMERNTTLFPMYGQWDTHCETLREWLRQRIDYLDTIYNDFN